MLSGLRWLVVTVDGTILPARLSKHGSPAGRHVGRHVGRGVEGIHRWYGSKEARTAQPHELIPLAEVRTDRAVAIVPAKVFRLLRIRLEAAPPNVADARAAPCVLKARLRWSLQFLESSGGVRRCCGLRGLLDDLLLTG